MRGLTWLLVIGGGAWALQQATGDKPKPPAPPRDDDESDGMSGTEIHRLIRERARAHDVPEPVALAFADVESRFNPHAQGDLKWATSDGGVRYRKHVLNNPAFADNPDRENPNAWHSYGLFQLHAAFHTPKGMRPRALLDPALNAELALATIGRMIKRYGSAEQARIAYVCGSPEGCSEARREEIVANFRRALAHWESLPVS